MKFDKMIYTCLIGAFLILTGCSNQNQDQPKVFTYSEMENLINAIQADDLEGTKKILRLYPIDVSFCPLKPGCPIHEARSPKMLELLIDKGASVDVHNQIGRTGLYYVRTPKMAREFIKRGADISGADQDPILNYWLRKIPTYAEAPLFIEKIKVGLNAGMSTRRKSRDSKTPEHILEDNKQKCQAKLEGYLGVPEIDRKAHQNDWIKTCVHYTSEVYPQLKKLIKS
jgi:hypothetical protein